MKKICLYGNPVLRLKSAPLADIDKHVGIFTDEMLEVLRAKNGVGLAAPQIGKAIRVFVIHVPPEYDVAEKGGKRLNPEINGPLVMINPVILSKKGAQNDNEGCLSIPEIFAPVHRAFEVSASFIDLGGNERRLTAFGLMARAIQHELDHLDGILFVDRLSAIKRISLAARLKRLKRATEREIEDG